MDGDASRLPAVPEPPTPDDYLPSVIQKQVLRMGLTHPLSLYPTAVGIGSALAGVILGMPILFLVALVGLVGPLSAVAQIMLFPDRLGKRYLASLESRREAYEKRTRQLVRKGLQQSCKAEEADRMARQGQQQFDKVAATLESIRQVLTMKLTVRELTFQRFLGAAEQAHLSVLDNLKSVVAMLRSLDSINAKQLASRIVALQHEQQPGEPLPDAKASELKALRERYDLWRSQLDQVARLLSKNEEALTAMEHISARVAGWRTDAQFAASDIESAIDDLRTLADFAHNMTNHLTDFTQGDAHAGNGR